MFRYFPAVVVIGLLGLPQIQAPASETPVMFPASGDPPITLRGLLHVPPEAPEPVPGAVICHPDPRYGGRMSSHVVAALQQACAGIGWATLRFNFRGVDGSEGSFDDGRGEMADCLGALDLLRTTPGVDPVRVAIVGYSFGSWVGLRAAVTDGRVPACVCLAFPVPADEDISKHTYFSEIRGPVLFVTGTADSISSLPTIEALIAAGGAADSCGVLALQGADHFYADPADLGAATAAIGEFLRSLPAPAP